MDTTATRTGAPTRRLRFGISGAAALALVLVPFLMLASPRSAAAQAYGSLNNFDCVNDTGMEAHGFEIELVDVHSTDITYTYDYNHYGIPKITEDTSDPLHPRVFVRYAATRLSDGTWSAYTAIPSGPISPTDGHQFTNPSVNFGGEHFGVGYYGTPTAVKYNWLIDDGSGHLVHGPPVMVATPTFTFYPAVVQVVPVVVPPPPPAPPVLQFGEATWVKDIKTTTPNAGKVGLRDLVDPDPANPGARNWANGEPAEVETEWRILQTEFANAANAKGFLEGAPVDLPGGDEVVTRRYEFYKYVGPLDAESGEAMADVVGPDGLHGIGTVTYNDHIDPNTGEWVTVTVDLSTLIVVGDFIGAQMSGFDMAPALGLVDHVPDGELGVAYAARRVVIVGGAAFIARITSGALPPGTSFDTISGVFSGTPTLAGVFTFTIEASDTGGALVSKDYSVTVVDNAAPPATSTVATIASPAAGGTTAGDGVYDNGTVVTVVATHGANYAFLNWTEGGVPVSASAIYPFTVNGNRTLVANFYIPTYTIATLASPLAGGTIGGGGVYDRGTSVTLTATANAGFTFVNWTEGGAAVSPSASYTFNATVDRSLVANFAPTYLIAVSANPSAGGTVSGGGTYVSGGNVTVVATPAAAYRFVNWTEGGAPVSTSASYTFAASVNRALMANFEPKALVLVVTSATAAHVGSKIDVTVVIGNSGDASASAVAIASRKDATIDGKSTNERPPVVLGNIDPGASATVILTFSGVKPGVRTLQLTVGYTGGTVTLTTQVAVP